MRSMVGSRFPFRKVGRILKQDGTNLTCIPGERQGSGRPPKVGLRRESHPDTPLPKGGEEYGQGEEGMWHGSVAEDYCSGEGEHDRFCLPRKRGEPILAAPLTPESIRIFKPTVQFQGEAKGINVCASRICPGGQARTPSSLINFIVCPDVRLGVLFLIGGCIVTLLQRNAGNSERGLGRDACNRYHGRPSRSGRTLKPGGGSAMEKRW